MHNELANKLLIHQWNRDLAKRTAAPTMSAQEQQTAADPYAELKAAWDAGRRIRISDEIYPTRWYSKSDGASLNWDCPPEDYEIDPLPADKWAAEKAAHAQGKKIECRYKSVLDKPWETTHAPSWVDEFEYRIAPDPTPAGKLSDELPDIDDVTSNCCTMEEARQMMLAAFDKVGAKQAEEIARLTDELASLQRSYEGERHCSGERMAQILELKREMERLTAERDRLTVIINQQGQRLSKMVWYDASVEPDCRDYPIVQDNDQQKMVVESGSSLCLINAKRWCSIPKAPAPSAEEVERERFEKVFSYWNLSRKADGDYVDPVAQGQWQGWQARAAKEVQR